MQLKQKQKKKQEKDRKKTSLLKQQEEINFNVKRNKKGLSAESQQEKNGIGQFVLQSMLSLCVFGHYTFRHMNNKYLYNGGAFWKLSTFILQSEIVWRDIRIAQNALINAFQIGHNGTETISMEGKKRNWTKMEWHSSRTTLKPLFYTLDTCEPQQCSVDTHCVAN